MLERLIDLRQGEGPVALRAFGALFALIAGHTVLETARDALFLERLPASRLALVYLALALIGVVLPLYNTRFVRSFGRRNAVVFTLMVAALGTTLWHFQAMNARTVYGLYIWSGLIGTVLAVQFWMFAGQLFTVAQGKRLFAGIASGGILGAVAGGAMATGMLELGARFGGLGVATLLLLAAAWFIAAAALLTSIPTDDVGTVFSATKSDVTIASGLEVLRDHRYVRRVAAFVGLSTLAVLATDYLFKFVAKAHVPAAELGPFFARYYTGLNAIALVVQLFVARRLMNRVGVVGSLAILPSLLLGGGAGIVFFGGVWVMVLLTKGADGSLRHSLHRVATELLLLPLPSEIRDRTKSLLDAVFVRGAQALGAGGILLLAMMGLESARVIAWIVVIMSTAWLLFAATLRRGYVDLLRREMGRGTVDLRSRSRELDIDSVESVIAALSSSDHNRVSAAMDLLIDSNRARLIPALILYHESEDLVLKGLDIVSRLDEQDWRPHAVRLAASSSVRLRTGALRALGRACEAELVRKALDDPSPEVRAHAAFQLARCEGGDKPTEHPAIQKLLADAAGASAEDRVMMRLGLLNALREDADGSWVEVLLAVAESDRSPRVVDAVAHAVMRVPDPRFVDVLVRSLDLRDARAAVRDALVRIGPPALDALSRALHDPDTPLALRRQTPITIAAFGTQRAANLLMEQLEGETDGMLRYRALRGLSRLVSEHPIDVNKAVIEAEMDRNLVEHLRLMSLLVPLDEDEDLPMRARGSDMLLTGLLSDKMRQASERSFRLFKILQPQEDVRSIFVALRSPNARTRAHAQEFLDALAVDCSERCRALFRIIADDLSMRDKVRRAASFIPAPPVGRVEAMRALLSDDDESVVSLAAYHATALGITEVTRDVESVVSHRPSLRAAANLGAAEAMVRAASAEGPEAFDG